MRGDFVQSMLPMAPLATMSMHPKPKVDFSIESIVGKDVAEEKTDEKSVAAVSHRIPGLATPPPAHTNKVASSFCKDFEGTALRRAEFAFGGRTAPGHHAHLPGVLSPAGMNYPHPGMLPYTADTVPSLYQPHFPLSPYYVGREYQNYPWIMARQPRLLPYRPQGGQGAGFILHQFRKPKRIRTAFSPSQLLTLEHAFEKNHYVVGAERKQLAQDLNLTETQVKVWFQNRRTKHKRQKQEEEQQPPNSGEASNASESDGQTRQKESDESDCESRDSSEASESPEYPHG